MNRNLYEKLALYTDNLITARIKEADFDKSYSGIISAILFEPDTDVKDVKFGTYKVRYKNMEQTVRIDDGIVHEIGERVNVYVPRNDPNRTIVEPIIQDQTPCEVVFDDNKGELVFHYEITTNQKIYHTERMYKIEYENKGTLQEKPVKITTPDGREIKLTGI